jgi:hypothetical protein
MDPGRGRLPPEDAGRVRNRPGLASVGARESRCLCRGQKLRSPPVTCGFARADRRPETGQSRPLEGLRGAPARESNEDEVWSDALRSSPVAPHASPQGKATEGRMFASVAPREVLARLRRGVAKPQVKPLIGVSDPFRGGGATPATSAARTSRPSPAWSNRCARSGRATTEAPAR